MNSWRESLRKFFWILLLPFILLPISGKGGKDSTSFAVSISILEHLLSSSSPQERQESIKKYKDKFDDNFFLDLKQKILKALKERDFTRAERLKDIYMEIANSLKSRLILGRALASAAYIPFFQKDYEKAIRLTLSSIAILKKIKGEKGKKDLGEVYFQLAVFYQAQIQTNLGIKEENAPKIEEALYLAIDIFKTINQKEGLINVLIELSSFYKANKMWDKMEEILKEALPIAEETKNKLAQARILVGMGEVLYLQNKESALTFLLKAEDTFAHIPEQEFEANHIEKNIYLGWQYSLLFNILKIQEEKRDWEKAIEYAKKLIGFAKELNDKQSLGLIYNNLGSYYKMLSLYEPAIVAYERASLIYKSLGNLELEAGIWINVFKVYYEMKKWQLAQNVLNNALNIYLKLKNYFEVANVYHLYASIYSGQLKFNPQTGIYQRVGKKSGKKALEYYRLAIKYYIKAGRYDCIPMVYCTIARNIYGNDALDENLIDSELAEEYFKNAIDLARNLKDEKMEAEALTYLAYFYDDEGRLKEAIEEWQKIIKIYENLKDKQKEALSYLSLTACRWQDKNLKETIKSGRYAARLLINQGEKRYAANLLSSIVYLAYYELGKIKEAIEILKEAARLYATLNDDEGQADCYLNLMFCFNALFDYQNAAQYGEKALTYLNKKSAADFPPWKKEKIHQFKKEAYSFLSLLYLNLGEMEKAFKYAYQSEKLAKKEEDYNEILLSLSILIILSAEKSDFKKVDNYYQQAEKIVNQHITNKTLFLLNVAKIISIVLKGEMSSLLSSADKYIKEMKDSYESESLFYAAKMSALVGKILFKRQDLTGALKYMEEAQAILEEIKIPDIEIYIQILRNTANIYKALGDKEKFQEMTEKADNFAKKEYFKPEEDEMGENYYISFTRKIVKPVSLKDEELIPRLQAIYYVKIKLNLDL